MREREKVFVQKGECIKSDLVQQQQHDDHKNFFFFFYF